MFTNADLSCELAISLLILKGLESEDHDLADVNPDTTVDIDDLIDELEDLSDSGPELDTVSVMSTPKPRLK